MPATFDTSSLGEPVALGRINRKRKQIGNTGEGSLTRASLIILAAGFLALAFPSGKVWAGEAQRPEISFTVHQLKETNVEGPDVERTYFMVGSKRIVFGLPKGCRLTVGDGFLLLPADANGFDGEIRVGRSAFTPEFDLAENALKYRSTGAELVPKDAGNLQVEQPQMNPYPYNGWKSLGFTWTYSAFGRPMTRTVSYINLEVGVQIMVTTVAAKADAEKVDKIAKQFISSWWVMADK